jgi:hypothetical protein
VILSLAWQVTRRAAAGWCWRCGCQPSRPGTGWRSGGSASQPQVAGKCLDANGQGTTNGSKVTLWTCNGQANQEWTRPDPALAHFSIWHDLGYIVPDLKEALALTPGLKLMANPKALAAKHDSSVATWRPATRPRPPPVTRRGPASRPGNGAGQAGPDSTIRRDDPPPLPGRMQKAGADVERSAAG